MRFRISSFIRLRRSVYHTRSRKLYLANKEATRALVHERVSHFNSYYKLPVGKIAIRNQRSRWGSCSRKGNLNFNYKLVFLPPALQDYIIVHEICHIREFNHGHGFWSLVGETMPEWKILRNELKRVGSRTSVKL
jgi:predicted metal-dependent hydrolase